MSQAPAEPRRRTPGIVTTAQLVLIVASQALMFVAHQWAHAQVAVLRDVALACAGMLLALSLFWVFRGPRYAREQNLAYILIGLLAGVVLATAPATLW